MKTPNVQTTNGVKPLTALPNEALVEGFLYNSDEDEEVSLVRLLSIVEPSPKKAGAILRECLTKGRSLVAVYPGNNETPPAKATYLGSIADGALYLV